MFLSLFYSDIHLLLKALVLQKYNTGISIEAKPNLTDVLFLIQLFQFDRKMSHDELLSIENWLTKAGRVLN